MKNTKLLDIQGKKCKFSGKLNISPTTNPKDEIQKSQSYPLKRHIGTAEE